MKVQTGTVLLALALSASMFGQAPQQAPPPPPPGKAIPSGIQTLPAASARDSVAASEVVLAIGNEKMTREQYEKFKQNLPSNLAPQAQAMGDRSFATNYARLRALVLLAMRDKLDESADFKNQLNFMHDQILAQMVVTKLQTESQTITEAEIKAYYDAHQAELMQGKLRGIFVALNPPAKPGAKPGEAAKARTDDEAKARAQELRTKIVNGADFAAVAKEESDHQASAEKGGDFGVVRKGSLPPSLETAVFSLKPQEISEPIKEGPGYYVFRLEELKQVTLDEATAGIRNKLQTEKFSKSVENAQNLFPVVLNDKYFGAPTPPPGAPQPASQAPAGTARPVVTGVAPAKPATPPPAVKK